jgi:CubicO group peptidase (beta-lactamase class C family)
VVLCAPPAARLAEHGDDSEPGATSPIAPLDDAGGPVRSTASPAAPPPRDLDELRTAIAAILSREQIPGAGVALVEGDRILWAGGIGVADRATGRPVTADTLFRTGSLTKSFIALAFVRLAEQGRVDLGARVSDLAPELAIGNRWDAEQPITVAHLLEHTAGFDDMRPNESFGPLAVEAMPLADILARNPASRVARWRPGSRFAYSNPGYTVAAYLLEKLTGLSLDAALAREIFAPLGITGAALRWTPEVGARLARGYHETDEPVPYRAIYHWPAGNLMASPRDVAALVRLGLQRGRLGDRVVISPAGMARVERSETGPLETGDGDYGLANYGEVSERAPMRGHGGGMLGYRSLFGYLPGHGVGYALLINASARHGDAIFEIRHLIVEYLLAGAAVPRPPARSPVSEADLQRWAGVYHFAAPHHQLFAFRDRLNPGIELFVEGGRPYLRRVPDEGWRSELVPLGGDRFRARWASGSHIAFGRDPQGRRIFVNHNGYSVEEPRSRTLAFVIAPRIFSAILATRLVLVYIAPGRRRRRSPGLGWSVCTSLAFVALPHAFQAALEEFALHDRIGPAVGLCLLTLAFAIGAAGSAVQALGWLPRPGAVPAKLYRLVFAVTACCVTGYLAAYGIIGIRLWSY